MEETTIQPNDDVMSGDSDDRSYDELLTALGSIEWRLKNAAYCWKESTDEQIDPAYEKKKAFEEFLDDLNRRLPKIVANETFRIVYSIESLEFSCLKRGLQKRKKREATSVASCFFICLLGILFLFAPDIRPWLEDVFCSLRIGFQPRLFDAVESLSVWTGLILLLGSASHMVFKTEKRLIGKRLAAKKRNIPQSCIVERRPDADLGIRVKVNLDLMTTIDEQFKIHKENLKILREKAKLFGFDLNKRRSFTESRRRRYADSLIETTRSVE